MQQQPLPIAQLITHLREQAGLTLYALERSSGIGRGTLWRIEHDEIIPDLAVLNAIARGLDMEPEELYDVAWSDLQPENLPALPGYFRQKYRLGADDIAYLQETVELLHRRAAQRRTNTKKKGDRRDTNTDSNS